MTPDTHPVRVHLFGGEEEFFLFENLVYFINYFIFASNNLREEPNRENMEKTDRETNLRSLPDCDEERDYR